MGSARRARCWIPAFAGMTAGRGQGGALFPRAGARPCLFHDVIPAQAGIQKQARTRHSGAALMAFSAEIAALERFRPSGRVEASAATRIICNSHACGIGEAPSRSG
ncbi:MAG TPA: hypothetical protein VHB74_09580 [Devosia sp.]|nr:hypothetical protein [Devosia sp.]